MDSDEIVINDVPSSNGDGDLSNKKIRKKITLNINENEQKEIINSINAKNTETEKSNTDTQENKTEQNANKEKFGRKILGKKFFSKKKR